MGRVLKRKNPYEFYLACHTCKKYTLAYHGGLLAKNVEQFLFNHQDHHLEFLDEKGVGFFPYLEAPDEKWEEEEYE